MRQVIQGKIRWFDGMSGEGMVRSNVDGRCFYLHFTAINGISKNNHHWPTDQDQEFLETIQNRPCEFELYEDPTFVQISKLVLK